MSRLVAGTLLLPDGTPMAGAAVYFTAKRTEPDAIVKGIDAFFKTNSSGVYSQEIENGWYTVTIEYQLSGTYPRRWTLGEVVIEDGPTTTLNALIIAMTPPDDPNLGIFQQLLLEAQAARDDAIDAANAAENAAAAISPEKQAQWDEAYSDRMKWDGGADGLNAAAGRASLQLKSAALQESTAFATAAQGAAADAALAGLAQKINTTEKGSANGVATLDSGGVVPEAQLPDFIKSDQRGVANGVATLGANALIPPSQLPSYVDDVLEVETFGDLPVEGEAGKIYIVKTAGTAGGDPFPANQQFRWSGTAYIKLVASPGTTDNVVEGAINLYFTAARAINSVLTGFVAATSEFTVTATDSVLGALQKVVGRLNQLGTASNLNAGTGADDLPSNADLNVRLGTEGNLGSGARVDIEEGDFTPVARGATTTGTATYTVQKGKYQRIGNRVQFQISLQWSGHTGSGQLRVMGLPFLSPAGNSFVPATIYLSDFPYTAGYLPRAYFGGGTEVYFDQHNAAGQALQLPIPATVGYVLISGSYSIV